MHTDSAIPGDDASFTARFWSRVACSATCWRWTGGHLSSGYGRCYLGHDDYAYAHRVAWVLTHGPLPPGTYLVRLPGCVQRDCVRPDHYLPSTSAHLLHATIDDLRRLVNATADPTGCWRWRGTGTRRQRPQTTLAGQSVAPHRVLYEQTYQLQLPPEVLLYARCGTPGCCNPAHQLRSDAPEAAAYRAQQPLLPRGECHYDAKLTAEQVRSMRARQAARESLNALARAYGVNVGTVHALVRRRTWKHVA